LIIRMSSGVGQVIDRLPSHFAGAEQMPFGLLDMLSDFRAWCA
jgi:hypothetical protein